MRARVTPGSLTPAQYRARSAGAAGIVTLLSIASVAATAIAAQPGAPTPAFVVCALLAVAFIILGNAAVGIAHMFAFTPKARDVELTCHKGMVEGPGFRLRAADIVGASTARLGTRGYLLSVETASGGIPHAIELETRAELDEVRRALGVARDGTRGLR
ncbi:MAG: hypothetical protein HOO96_05350, partial [Polyangiaceae bacterium]|nr:hypothetical protein [Polyangiaceae bacterium]